MKKRTAASTMLISLAAAVGCGTGDGEYIDYTNTTPANFGQSQSEKLTSHDKAVNGAAGTPGSVGSAGPNQGEKNAETSVKPASHSSATTNAAGTEAFPDVPQKSNVKSIVSVQSGLTGPADVPQIDTGTSSPVNKIELLIPNKTFRHERGTDAVRISYDDIDLLKVLNMEPVPPNAPVYFPEWLAGLNGKRIRIRGWMYPTFVSEGLTSFTMARDNGICCFQRMPKIYDVIFVKLAKGEQTDYIAQRPFDIEGTFRIDSEGDGSELPRLYKIENARVLD